MVAFKDSRKKSNQKMLLIQATVAQKNPIKPDRLKDVVFHLSKLLQKPEDIKMVFSVLYLKPTISRISVSISCEGFQSPTVRSEKAAGKNHQD